MATGSEYGRGTGVPDPIDVYVGTRIRSRRLLIGMNQEALAQALGLTFQQVQKYEGGANRVSASRLHHIAEILQVPVGYFYDGLEAGTADADEEELARRERLRRPEVIELVRSYYAIGDARVRSQFLAMMKTLAEAQRPGP